jgi:hypothetical protein
MNETATEMESRPNYYKGQLLQAEDFLAEQNYHVKARRLHNLHLHGWGIVEGLKVTRESDRTLAIAPGVAVDENGDEIVCAETRREDVTPFQPNLLLRVGLTLEEEGGAEGMRRSRIRFQPRIFLSESAELAPAVTLATVQLDGEGRIARIGYQETRYVRSVLPGSVTADELNESLRKGWLRMPFRPCPMIKGLEKVEVIPPPFDHIGVTEAKVEAKDGAGGSMAIPVPQNVRQITGLRVAGEVNDGEINVRLVIGGWNYAESRHFRSTVVTDRIPTGTRAKGAGGSDISPFLFETRVTDGWIDPEWHTLSIVLWSTSRASISLVAVEYRY